MNDLLGMTAESFDSADDDADLKSPSYGRYVNMNMSIRMPSTEDASLLQQEGELGLDSAR